MPNANQPPATGQARPLAGITVIDLGQIYNGPYCGYLLAMAGARVIKVEPPGGEASRGPRAPSSSYAFLMLNGNKECVTLNLKHPRGQELLRGLAAKADVLLENFSPGTLDKYGVGSDALRAENPRLVYAAGTGFGRSGPHRDYLAMDITVQAMTGAVAITGNEGEPPLKAGPALADILGGAHLYAGIVTALLRRERTGEGAVVDVAMQDAVFPTLITALGAYYHQGGNPPRTGNHHQNLSVAPYNVYPAKDGHVAIICIREAHWRSLLTAMGKPELGADARFENMAARAKNMEATDAVVTAWTETLPKAKVFQQCQQHDVICAPVQSLHDVLHDPHLLARGTLAGVPHERFDEVRLPNTPLRFEGEAPLPVRLPRANGADNKRVFGELLGLAPDAVTELAAEGAI